MHAATKLLERLGKRRRQVAVAAAGVTVASGVVGWAVLHPAAEAAPVPVAAQAVDAPAPALALVFVSGAVQRPGMYRLSPDARVADAIAAAGGITAAADPGHLPNLAARVHDGRQINVPFRKTGSNSALKLDINTATEDELASVPGMPAGLAQAIVEYRDTWGPFASMSQLHTDLDVDSATEHELTAYIRVVPPAP